MKMDASKASIFKTYLFHDEEIVWVDSSGGDFNRNWKILLFVATVIFIAFAFISYFAEIDKGHVVLWASCIMAAFTAFLLPALIIRSLKNTTYAITTKRIFIHNGKTLKSCELYRIDRARLIMGKNRRGTIAILINFTAKSISSNVDKTIHNVLSFIDVENAEEVYGILVDRLNALPDRTDMIFPG